MPSIPTYQRQFLPQGDLVGARANTNIAPDDAIGRAMQGIGQQGMGLANTMMQGALQDKREADKKAEDLASVQVANVLSEGDVYWQEHVTRTTQGWKVGDPDLRETLGKDFDTWTSTNTEKLPTDASKQYFQKHAAGMKSRLQTSVFSFQEKATTAKLDADTSVGMQADENSVFKDPARFYDVYRRRMEAMIARSDMSESQKIEAAAKYKAQLSLAVERGQIERDPAGWYKERFGSFRPTGTPSGTPGAVIGTIAGGGFDAVIKDVLRHEGGYAASDGASGHPVIYGLNRGSNKAEHDEAVRITKQDGEAAGKSYAVKVYKEKYWDAIGADNLPPELQGTAMDAAVNQGQGNAKKWIAESSGDVVKFNALRRAHYETLLEHPKHAQSRNAWMKRMAEAESGKRGPAAAPGAPPSDGASYSDAPKPPATFSNMDYEKQIALKNQAETMLNQAESTFRAYADRVVQNAMTMHKKGVMDPTELQLEFFQRAYGPDAVRMQDEYMKSREMGSDIGKFKNQSEAEITAELQASEPVAGAGYASDDSRRNTRVQAAQQVLQARKADPAGYVASTNESLTRQRAAIDNPQTPPEQRPALVQQYVRESLAEQQRLGIQNPTIMTPRQADAIAQRAMTATRPEDSANLIGGLEAEYGTEFFPKVFGELAKAGKISGELLIIPSLPSQSAREAVSRLARVKESDLTVGITSIVQKDVKDAVTAEVVNYAKAIPIMTQQAASVVGTYETSMRKIAYSLVSGGMSSSDAVAQANKMLLGHHQFDGTMRVPESVNLSLVQRGADFMLKNDLAGIDPLPDQSMSRDPAALSVETKIRVQANAQWFTSDKNDGLTLFAVGQNGVRYRITRNGNPVTYPWADLLGRVATSSGRISSGKITDMAGSK